MRRRRSRPTFDATTIPVLGIALFLLSAWAFPRFALAAALILGVAAIVLWYIGARKRLRTIERWAAVSNMYALSPEEFEGHVASTYRALGYRTTTTRRIGDQGIDVLAERGQERIGIQCKRTTETVSNSAVQEAYAGQAHYKCTSSAVVSLGGFTAPARALAATTGVRLIDGIGYADLFHRASAAKPARPLWTVIPPGRVALSALSCGAAACIALWLGITRLNAQLTSPTSYATTVMARNAVQRSPRETVEQFYSAINAKQFRTAYAMLSPSFTTSATFESFRAGYATTVSVSATTSEVKNGTTIPVRLRAVDRNPDGSTRVTIYNGHWSVIADGNGIWLLDAGTFRRV